MFCSFHGDTNGLATMPIIEAVYRYSVEVVPDHILVFGLVWSLVYLCIYFNSLVTSILTC